MNRTEIEKIKDELKNVQEEKLNLIYQNNYYSKLSEGLWKLINTLNPSITNDSPLNFSLDSIFPLHLDLLKNVSFQFIFFFYYS
jgi:hypothetical protein